MDVEVMLRRRPALAENVVTLGATFISNARFITRFLKEVPGAESAKVSLGSGESAILDLRGSLVAGLGGQIVYAARLAGYLSQDSSQFDDFLTLAASTKDYDHSELCTVLFPKLVETFGPYRASIHTDKTVQRADWKSVRSESQQTGRDIDGRDSVFRIWPVNFFDDLLCRRSFGVSCEDVVRRASPECEQARIVSNGAFLLVTSVPLVGEALDDLDSRVRTRLCGRPIP
jgi:hypothetical protein